MSRNEASVKQTGVIKTKPKDGVWFDMPTGGRVKLKMVSPKEFRKIFKATSSKEPLIQKVDGKAQLFEREMIDEDLRMSMYNDASIVDWENQVDEDGNSFPCTSANKDEAMLAEDSAFRDFVNEKLKELSEVIDVKNKAVEKN